jgi:hypothetical protein
MPPPIVANHFVKFWYGLQSFEERNEHYLN